MKNSAPKTPLKKKIHIPTTTEMIKLFLIFFAGSLFISVVMAAASGGESWKYMLFHNGPYTDMYMDFFNSIRDGGSDNVYSERNNIYPPLCVLIFRIFSRLIDPELVSTMFKHRTRLQADQISMIIYILFALICIMSMMRLIESYANIKTQGKMKTQAAIISFTMIVCYPVMFCLERGNILILSVILAMFFIFFKDSENKIIRELSFIALAVSAAIKLYPAIFGLALIIEKKYKQAARLMIYGILIVGLPIVFFLDEFKSQPASISAAFTPLLSISSNVPLNAESASIFEKLIKNLLNFAVNKKSSLNFSSVSVQNFVFMAQGNPTIAKIICAVTEVIAAICAFKTKSEWKKAFLLCYLMLNIPSASNSYALSFLLIPFCIFLFGTSEYEKKDWAHLSLFALLLTPLPTLWFYHPEGVQALAKALGLYYNTQLNQNIATFVFQLLFTLIVVETIVSLVKRSNNKKTTVNEDENEKTTNDISTDGSDSQEAIA